MREDIEREERRNDTREGGTTGKVLGCSNTCVHW